MTPDLATHANYWLVGALLLIGLYGMIAKENMMKKLMAMNVMQVAVIIFFLALAQKSGATAPILVHGAEHAEAAEYVNPLPHALMLTAIVVSLSTTGVALALLMRIHRRHGSLEEPDVLRTMGE